MPRDRRISLEGYPHLVIAQANGGTVLFRDDEDYQLYLLRLKQLVREKYLKLLAFCLCQDELRLVLVPERLPLSRLIQRLHVSHTTRMNKKLARRGSLFRSRFRSIVFGHDDMTSVIRSVHLWPIRSGLSRRSESYPYCSHGAYLSALHPWHDLIASQVVLSQFDENIAVARRIFSRYVESAALEEDDFGVMETARGLGGMQAAIQIPLQLGDFFSPRRKVSIQSLAKRVALVLNVSAFQLESPSRRQDLVMARRLLATCAVVGSRLSNQEIAAFLNRDKGQISRLVSQGLDMLETDEPFRTLFESVKGKTQRKIS